MKKKKRILQTAGVLLLASAVLLLTACKGSDKSIRFGTAGIGGNYYSFGQAFAGILSSENEDLEFIVKVTAGSAANLRLLSGGYIQMAIAQADVISDACSGTGAFEGKEPLTGFSAVAGLYTEACHIVTARDSGIESIRDLRGKKVSIGEKESGTEQNAAQILLAYGLSDKMLEEVNMNYTEAAKALKSGEIDAFFCTVGVQAAVVEELAKQMDIRLLPVNSVEQESLLSAYDYFSPYTIPAGTYTGQQEDVETIGVKSVLIASDKLSEDTVSQGTKALYDHVEELQLAIPVDFSLSTDGIPLPLHKGAER